MNKGLLMIEMVAMRKMKKEWMIMSMSFSHGDDWVAEASQRSE